uniref:Uncharacterized protein n=1 Tax=Salix viminalis TaxID=40686 RepID=A0A6N2LCA5_SALVM
MRGATRELPRRSPILVLLSPKQFNCGVLMGSGALVLYGIATLTAGSLEFKISSGPWLRQF